MVNESSNPCQKNVSVFGISNRITSVERTYGKINKKLKENKICFWKTKKDKQS